MSRTYEAYDEVHTGYEYDITEMSKPVNILHQ